jgi:ADP-heptose:LPS heptosyltransferase
MAAALGKPVVALMPEQNILSWYPWQVENIILSAPGSVSAIEVADVAAAVEQIVANLSKRK